MALGPSSAWSISNCSKPSLFPMGNLQYPVGVQYYDDSVCWCQKIMDKGKVAVFSFAKLVRDIDTIRRECHNKKRGIWNNLSGLEMRFQTNKTMFCSQPNNHNLNKLRNKKNNSRLNPCTFPQASFPPKHRISSVTDWDWVCLNLRRLKVPPRNYTCHRHAFYVRKWIKTHVNKIVCEILESYWKFQTIRRIDEFKG